MSRLFSLQWCEFKTKICLLSPANRVVKLSVFSSVCLSVCPLGGPHVTTTLTCSNIFTWDPPAPTTPHHTGTHQPRPCLSTMYTGILRTYSNFFNLDLLVDLHGLTHMDIFLLVCYVFRTVGKQTVGIPQKCVLTGSCVFQFIFVFAIIDYGPPEYGSYLYPQWAQLLGWLTSASILAWIPGVAIYEVCRQEGGIKKVGYLWKIKTIAKQCMRFFLIWRTSVLFVGTVDFKGFKVVVCPLLMCFLTCWMTVRKNWNIKKKYITYFVK